MATAPEPSPKILFEDDAILVLDKPAGLVVHPAPSHKGLTVVDWLKTYLGPKRAESFPDPERLGVVHRLDKDTSGVLMTAKNAEAQTSLGRQFHDRLVAKQYAAFVERVPPKNKGIISAPIGRSRKDPSRMAVTGTGRPSETTFEVIEKYREVALVNLFPKTGRTHQLRVHCAAIGHPIVGDRTYGSSEKWTRDFGIHRPLLHAETLEINHPVTGKRLRFSAPWPQDMKKARSFFRRTIKAAAVALIFMGLLTPLRAEDPPSSSGASSKTTTKHKSSSSGTSTSSVKREMASLHTQFKALIEEVSALQDRVTSLQSSVDQLNQLDASRRLHDLEKAMVDLNGKATSVSSVSEETKSQALDISRKVKDQQDTLDQLRDQVDRLQSQLTELKAHAESPAATPAEGGAGK